MAWIELALLRRALGTLLPEAHLPVRSALRMAGLAFLSTIPATLSWWLFRDLPVSLTAIGVVAAFAAFYLGLAQLFGMSELRPWLRGFRGRMV